jgi:sigma-B regulation protein RsbU (phosphoserine phosphatase)
VVPILLILTLVGICSYALASQIAVYLVTSELDRRIDMIDEANGYVSQTGPEHRAEVIARIGESYRHMFPDIVFSVDGEPRHWQWPENSQPVTPPPGWKSTKGLLFREGRYYAWSHVRTGATQFTVMAPLTRAYLSEMIPGLAEVSFFKPRTVNKTTKVFTNPAAEPQFQIDEQNFEPLAASGEPAGKMLPEPVNRLDVDVRWPSLIAASDWRRPGATEDAFVLVHTRPSAILQTIFSRKVDKYQGVLPIVLLVVSILFLLVEMAALIIGISLTRTVTSAVHALYVGTQRVIEGDFSFRIPVPRTDQIGELTTSFNVMTAKVERLLDVAKEKERLQAELEIAREVQNQLYPKTVPEMRTLRLHAMCEPARTVSGDYYDYQCVDERLLAVAIGDVAGKGISAALLMATIQSSMRTQMRRSLELAAPGGRVISRNGLSTAHLVSELNQQLYAFTSAEKFATFCFGLYDDVSGMFTYTNAGHLPPVLVRKGVARQLEVNGMVVGAFPFSTYEESRIQLESGDLLVCYTDGITEPENEYGEMFDEERLIDLITKNADREDDRIIETVMEAVHQWTGSPELSDDMTILLARKL